MLRKFIAIKNVGRFRNSASTPNPQLAKHTFIVGANGYGKTTLCAVLRSLKTGNAAHILGRKTLGVTDPISIELLLPGGNVRFDGTTWSVTHPSIAIFDGVFVSENVHSGEAVEIDHKRNLYRVIIGDDGVRLAEEEAALATASRAKTTEITAAAKAIQPHLPAGMKIEAFLALASIPDLVDRLTAQESILAAAREAAAIRDRDALAEIPAQSLPDGFEDLLGLTLDGIAQEAEHLVAGHISSHPVGGPWIAGGLDYADAGTCPFCGQGIEGLPLIAAYRAVFSTRFKALAADIASMKDRVIQQFGEGALARLGTHAERNRANMEFWAGHCTFDPAPLTFPSNLAAAARGLGAAALDLLDRKARAPLEAIALEHEFATVYKAFDAVREACVGVNAAIRDVNGLIAAKKVEAGAVDPKAAETELNRLRAVRTRHTEPVLALAAEHARLVAEKDDIDRRKDAARTRLDKHTNDVVQPYERRINELLAGFNAGFSISRTTHGYPGGVATSSYQLVINNTTIDVGDGRTPFDRPSFKNTLSAGDKTTLALAFFIAHLERDPDIANKIAVFDDPFSSQDSFRRRQTVHEIVKIAGRCSQVIVLSHDATFLKQVWDKTPIADRTALTIADHRAQGSKLMPVDLDTACRGRTATDIDDLQSYLATGAGQALDIVRKMRVVLETHCRTTYPACFEANDWLGDMVRKTREGGETHPAAALYDELDLINDYTKQYHHGEDMADATPDQIDAAELTGYTRRTLRIVNALQA